MRRWSLLVAVAFTFVSIFSTQALAAREDANKGARTDQQGARTDQQGAATGRLGGMGGQQGTTSGQQDAASGRDRVGVAEMAPMRVSNITGATVNNFQGEQLGTIEDLVLGKEGQINYMILSHGGVLGVGDRLFAIPWEAVRPGAQANTFMLNIDRQRLANAPNFERNTWPNFADPDVQHLYYGYYFTEGEQRGGQREQQMQQKDRQKD